MILNDGIQIYPECSMQYRLVWCPRFSSEIWGKDFVPGITGIINDICAQYRYSVKELQIDKQYILVVVICKPTVAPSDILKTLMAMSTIALIRKYSSLRIFYAKNGSLWDKKCMLSTVGRVNKGIMEGFLDNWLKQKT